MGRTALTLEFDATTHEYRIAGRRVPSVTEVLENVGLIDYSYIPWPTRQMALERGRLVHEAISLHFADELDEDAAEESGILPYVRAAQSALRVLSIRPPLSYEQRVYHPELDYAGTLDLLANAQHGSAGMIVDWKTTQAEYWVRFQLAAYAAALTASDKANGRSRGHWGGALIRRICVELHPDATFRIFEVPAADWHRDFQAFCAALTIWREKQFPRGLQ